MSEAKATNRSGVEAQSSASFSFCSFTIWPARSRPLPYQNGLIDRTSMSTACASMAASRLSISIISRRPLHRRPDVRRLGPPESSDGDSASREQSADFAELAMSVHVDGFDPLATDHDGQCHPYRLLGVRAAAGDRHRKRRCRWRRQQRPSSKIDAVWACHFPPHAVHNFDAATKVTDRAIVLALNLLHNMKGSTW